MRHHPRLDAPLPQTFHHVRVRGLERRVRINADTDRDDCVAREAALAVPFGGQPVLTLTAIMHSHPGWLEPRGQVISTGTQPRGRRAG